MTRRTTPKRRYAELEARLGHTFRDAGAVRDGDDAHVVAERGAASRSAATTSGSSSSATRCWTLVVSDVLMRRFPDRARAICRARGRRWSARAAWRRWRWRSISGAASCSARARSGPAAASRPSILANALEALMGAIYVDGGLRRRRGGRGAAVRSARSRTSMQHARLDYKSRLQERAQALWQTAPVYEVVAEDGPDHDKRFEVALSLRRPPVRPRDRPVEEGGGAGRGGGRRWRRSSARRERRMTAPDARARSPPTCWRCAAGCATRATRRTWSAAACATCCSAAQPADFDVATDARPEAVLELFGKTLRDPDRPQARHGHGADRHRAAAPRRGDDVPRRGRLPRRPPPVVGHVRQVAGGGSRAPRLHDERDRLRSARRRAHRSVRRPRRSRRRG